MRPPPVQGTQMNIRPPIVQGPQVMVPPRMMPPPRSSQGLTNAPLENESNRNQMPGIAT